MSEKFEYERRFEVKKAFEDLEKKVDHTSKVADESQFDIRFMKEKIENIHKEKNRMYDHFKEKTDKIELQLHGDGNEVEGLIRKMDKLNTVPNLIRINTATMRWAIVVMVTVNLALFTTILGIVNKTPK